MLAAIGNASAEAGMKQRTLAAPELPVDRLPTKKTLPTGSPEYAVAASAQSETHPASRFPVTTRSELAHAAIPTSPAGPNAWIDDLFAWDSPPHEWMAASAL